MVTWSPRWEGTLRSQMGSITLLPQSTRPQPAVPSHTQAKRLRKLSPGRAHYACNSAKDIICNLFSPQAGFKQLSFVDVLARGISQ